jgi:hypothetical protein
VAVGRTGMTVGNAVASGGATTVPGASVDVRVGVTVAVAEAPGGGSAVSEAKGVIVPSIGGGSAVSVGGV